ncbi:FliO/MopB family protein [Cellulomonas carbonis]|uniref:Flagellar protein n=1 Tax=Cellulomonas carbonis T26 TaxID=947969 RepID=A0A0A0BM04_9CELL|nr:flagellar biosynthetic protein FliO [Cellulomonas carbonis]KGM08915.1 flagellar protein [Cellulomonas carbonis T26]GGC01689.1 hypothetical protein GCM10010972_13140 [Cellulomonas carbonis]
MDTSSVVLGLRVVLSLACVLGLIWYANRRLSGTGRAGAAVRRIRRAQPMTLVSRQSLGGKNGLALVDVGGRRLVLGVGEHGVTLLTEVEPPAPEPEDDVHDARVPLTAEELAALAGDDLDLPDLAGALPDVPSDLSSLEDAPSSTPAARTPAVIEPRNPLEGSILDATTWRRAVVAVQERTIRR